MALLRFTNVYPTRQVESVVHMVPELPNSIDEAERLFSVVIARPIQMFSCFGLVHDPVLSEMPHLYRKGGKYYMIYNQVFYKLEDFIVLRKLYE
jgi:hypothetical protein